MNLVSFLIGMVVGILLAASGLVLVALVLTEGIKRSSGRIV